MLRVRARSAAAVLSLGVCGSVLYYVTKRSRGGTKGKGVNRDQHGGTGDGVHQFRGKTVVITGAGGDIGSAAARAFARRGARLLLVDLPHVDSVLKGLCAELEEEEGAEHVVYTSADMSKQEDVEQMVEFAKNKFGRVDCLFNNAGVQGQFRPIHDQCEETFQKTLQVNVFGVFLAMKYVSRLMKDTGGGGVIVNTASLAGMLGAPNMAAYVASKHAVVGMTKTAAKDLAPHGIRVCAVSPGLLEGRMWASQVKGQAQCRKRLELGTGLHKELGAEAVSEEEFSVQEKRMLGGVPLGRLGRPDEVASVVVFLCSNEASYLTGTVIPIDGGKIA